MCWSWIEYSREESESFDALGASIWLTVICSVFWLTLLLFFVNHKYELGFNKYMVALTTITTGVGLGVMTDMFLEAEYIRLDYDNIREFKNVAAEWFVPILYAIGIIAA